MTSTPVVTTEAVAAEQHPCQHTGCRQYSRAWRPAILNLSRTLFRVFRSQGLVATVRRSAGFLQRLLHPHASRASIRSPASGEVLGLQPGERVRVKTLEQIHPTLDRDGKQRGLGFLSLEMASHCGREYRVHKRVERIYLEESRQNRKLKNTVLLEGVQCQGTGIGCDRSCFLYWREAWLERLEEQPPCL